jgi:hypothetical protein
MRHLPSVAPDRNVMDPHLRAYKPHTYNGATVEKNRIEWALGNHPTALSGVRPERKSSKRLLISPGSGR